VGKIKTEGSAWALFAADTLQIFSEWKGLPRNHRTKKKRAIALFKKPKRS